MLSVASIIMFLLVKISQNDLKLIGGASNRNEKFSMLENNDHIYQSRLEKIYGVNENETRSDVRRQVVGTLMSIFAGLMFGFSYTPITYIQNNYYNASQDYNDYAFSFSCGIFLSSICYFVLYCIFEMNNPQIYPQTILPGLVTGFYFIIQSTK